jgi:hypothetical protein
MKPECEDSQSNDEDSKRRGDELKLAAAELERKSADIERLGKDLERRSAVIKRLSEDLERSLHPGIPPGTLGEGGRMGLVALTAEMAAKWNEQAGRVLVEHPEARPYVELRHEWQELYQRMQMSKTAEAMLEERELAARLRMTAAYEALPLEVKAVLVF